MNFNTIEKKEIGFALFVSVILFMANEFLFYNKNISIIISILLLTTCTYYLLIENFSLLIKILLYVYFLIATRPRELHLLAIEDRGNFSYYSPNILKLVGASSSTMILFIVCIYLFINIIFKRKSINSEMLLPLYFLFFVIALTIINYLPGKALNFQYILVDLKHLLFIVTGLLLVYVSKYNFKELIYDILFISMVLALMFILYFLKDIYTGELLLKYNHATFISIIGLALGLTTNTIKKNIKLYVIPFLIIGAIPITRGEQLIFLISIVISFVYIICRGKSKYDLFSAFLALITAALAFGYLLSFDNALSDFILRKLEFFLVGDTLIDKSSSIRVVEFFTILSNSGVYNIFNILFGNGLGSTFSFDYSYTSNLDLADFNREEIESNRFLMPHLFISYWLLKFGLIGTIFIITIYTKYFLLASGYRLIYLIFLPTLLWQAYWSPGYAFLTGVLFGVSLLMKETYRHE